MIVLLPFWAMAGSEKVVPSAAACSPCQLLVPNSFQ
jgi:hypothetical protein